MENYQALDIALKFGNFALTIGVGLYVWFSNNNDKTSKEIKEYNEKTSKEIKEIKTDFKSDFKSMEDDVDSRMESHGKQLARMEEALKQAPNREEQRQIHLRINEVCDQVSTLSGKFNGAENTLKLIHEHLLKGGNK